MAAVSRDTAVTCWAWSNLPSTQAAAASCPTKLQVAACSTSQTNATVLLLEGLQDDLRNQKLLIIESGIERCVLV
jgi:hypothetical protein